MTLLMGLMVIWAIAGADPAPDRIPPADFTGSCTNAGCHGPVIKRAKLHDPVAQGSCDTCHESTDKAKHQFKRAAEGSALCTGCHDAPKGKVKHDPVEQGDCTVCHDPHGSAGEHFLNRPTVGEVCAECHEDVTKGLRFLHGPTAAGACTACHRPHASDQAKLLNAPAQELCLKCHAAVKERLNGKSHKHAPAEDDCTGCHHPHGADDKMMLKAAAPGLCFSCHDDIATKMKEARVAHAPTTAGTACANCHEAHASDYAGLLKQDPAAVCVSCHDRTMDTRAGRLENFKQLLADNPQHHGPVADNDCTACHREVHGGEHFRLLADSYPATFYAPYADGTYALCFGCHDAKAFRDARTTKATEFRNGDQNLHYLHVNRTVKGRSCRACHQPHASRNKQFIADAVPFGGWDIPITFNKNASGGGCLTGCHRLYRYDRQTPVANLPGTPTSGPAATTQPAS